MKEIGKQGTIVIRVTDKRTYSKSDNIESKIASLLKRHNIDCEDIFVRYHPHSFITEGES